MARNLQKGIREYGRAWLRHEAEQFARDYLDGGAEPGRAGRDGSGVPGRGVLGVDSLARAIDWRPAPGGYLHAQDSPGLKANLGRFFGRVKQFVREVIVAGVMGLLGPAPLTAEELEAAEADAVRQEQYFDKLLDEVRIDPPAPRVPAEPLRPGEIQVIKPPAMTPKQFVARVERYADSAWQSAQRINRKAAVSQGIAKRERRVLGHPKFSHCTDCPPLAEMGWQPVGTLPDIGDTECGPLCLCHFSYQDDKGNEFFHGNKGPIPAPAGPATMEPDDDGVYPVAEPPDKSLIVPVAGPPKGSLKAQAQAQAGVKFVPNHVAQSNPGEYATVVVDVAKADAAFAADENHVGPGGSGAAIGGRYEGFQKFLADSRETGRKIEQPRAGLTVDGELTILDGRHRWAVFRDEGQTLLPISVPKSDAAKIRKEYGPPR